MQSKDIIIKLIDEGKVSGEEAYALINDIVAADILESVKNLGYGIGTVDRSWTDKLIINPTSPTIVPSTAPSITPYYSQANAATP